MRKILLMLPLLALIVGCSDNESLENKGREAGAVADKAIDRVDKRVDAEREGLEKRTATVREDARGVEQDVKDGLDKVDRAADETAAELKK
jgi:hypothetical protein